MGDFQRKPPPKSGGSEKRSGGGFWGFLGDIIKNVSIDVSVGSPSRSGTSARNPIDPRERMEPVHAERKEAYEETIYRKTDGAEGTAPAVRVDRDRKAIARSLETRREASAETRVPQSVGASLSGDVRAKMEPKLGSDLSNVRVHTDGESAAAAEGMSAKAFTIGSDVHFGSGQYQPGTKEGDKLLAHELTHVLQGQRSGIQRKAETPEAGALEDEAGHDAEHADVGRGAAVSHPDEPAEKEADAVAEHVSGQLEAEGAHSGAAGENLTGAHGGAPGRSGQGKAGGKGSKAGSLTKAGDVDGASNSTNGADKSGGSGAAPGVGASGNAADGGGAGAPQHRAAQPFGGEHGAGSAGQPSGDAKPVGGAASSGKSGDGGGGGSQPPAAPAPSKAAPPIATKRDPHKVHLSPRHGAAVFPSPNSGRKIFRSPTPAPAPAPAPSPAPADPFLQFCKMLPADIQGPAQALTDAAQKAALQTVGLAFARAFLALRQAASRLEMPALSWDQKSYLQTMALSADELQLYETLDSAKKTTWRDQLTPDERKDAKKLPPPALTKLLTMPPELQTWRVLRVKTVIGADVSNRLTAAGENVEQIVDALSAARGGDRLRPVLMDPQLPPATKVQFMRDVKAKLPTAADPFEAMKQCQPSYKMLGNDASKDGQFATMEILKALPLVNFPKFGSVPPGKVVEACKTAPDSDKRIPRKAGSIDLAQLTIKITTDKTLANQLANDYFPKYARDGGVGTLSGCDVDIVGGRGGLPAYWVYDAKAGMTIGKVAPEQVAHALAVDENPAYLTGGALVALPQALKMDFAASKQIKRPTAIDGLAFDQFQIVEDPGQCFGITAGGVGEVVVGPTKFSQTTPKKTF